MGHHTVGDTSPSSIITGPQLCRAGKRSEALPDVRTTGTHEAYGSCDTEFPIAASPRITATWLFPLPSHLRLLAVGFQGAHPDGVLGGIANIDANRAVATCAQHPSGFTIDLQTASIFFLRVARIDGRNFGLSGSVRAMASSTNLV